MRLTHAERAALKDELKRLRERHRDLDAGIEAMIAGGAGAGAYNQIELQRLKKEKLQLKDEIAAIDNRLLPDIIA